MGILSIIVAVYNVENYLSHCIESLCKQTYKNLEIILVDDGSTDRSGDICDEYAKQDSRIVVIHQSNAGVSAARNAALRICRGDYITLVDSDDYVLPEVFGICVENIEKHNRKSKVIFNNGDSIIIDCPYFSIKNQIFRCNMLDAISSNRKNSKKSD